MKPRFYFLFAVFTLLFLFYPGNFYYYDIFAHNRSLFENERKVDLKIKPIPALRTSANPVVTAQGVYIVDLESFTPVYEKNAKSRFLPASTTKIVTALVAQDIFRPDQIITVRKNFREGHVMELVRGERITVENLLYGVLVYSGNDAAMALAEEVGYEKFIDLMNKKAGELNMKDTQFKNPHGLEETGHYTTAYDLTLAARELLESSYLSKFVSTKDITVSDVDFKYFHRLTNINELLGEVQGLGGLKTGYTENAGENLVSFYRHDGHDFIITVIKSEDRFQDTENIISWIKANVYYINPASLD